MSVFTLLKLAEAVQLIQDALFNEAVTTVAENKNESSRKFFVQKINEVFGRTDAEDRITVLRELKEILTEGVEDHEHI